MRTTLIALAAVAALALAGCGDGDEAAEGAPESPSASTPSATPSESPSASPSGSVTSSPVEQLVDKGRSEEVTIQGGNVTPNAKRVDIGTAERLMLTVSSDRAGELHVHTSPDQEIAFPRGSTVHDLVFDSPGIVEIEEHESGVVILRVYVS
jgi:hypothetical protein